MYRNTENDSPVFVIHHSMTPEQRKETIKKYKNKTTPGTHQIGKTSGDKEYTAEIGIEKVRRDSGVYFIQDDMKLSVMIFNLIRIANTMSEYDFELTAFEAPQFTRYTKKQHYNFHVDSDAHHNRKFAFQLPKERELAFTNQVELMNTIRKMSCSVILNDDYEGGEFCTKIIVDGETVEHTIPAVAGDTLVFPSYINHCVKPVKKGVRYSLVQWAAGPKFV